MAACNAINSSINLKIAIDELVGMPVKFEGIKRYFVTVAFRLNLQLRLDNVLTSW